jgi:hypothetical protein
MGGIPVGKRAIFLFWSVASDVVAQERNGGIIIKHCHAPEKEISAWFKGG